MPISRRVYREEIADLAAAGCRYLQLDETNFAYLCDPKLREQVQNIGEDPDTLPQTYAKLINAVDRRASRADMVTCMHLCRGNFKSAWVAEGGYEPVAEVLFNEIDVDGYFLEYDDARSGDFAPLRFVPKGKTVVLGLVTTKLRAARDQGRAEAAHRGGGEVLPARPAGASARNAASPAPSTAMTFRVARRDRETAAGGGDRQRGLGLMPFMGDFGAHDFRFSRNLGL